MLDGMTKGATRFTIYHGFAVSLALHSAVALPLVLRGAPPPPEDASTLVFELDGLVADQQAEQKQSQQQEIAAQTQQANLQEEKPEDRPKDVEQDEGAYQPPPEKSAKANAGATGANVASVEDQQVAQTIRSRDAEMARIKEYVKLLSKRVQSKLVYPEEGRHAGLQGAATVSFAILSTGQIRGETLKIVESSGQAKLDASAIKTVRASAPFAPPPKEMTIAIAVAFGRKN